MSLKIGRYTTRDGRAYDAVKLRVDFWLERHELWDVLVVSSLPIDVEPTRDELLADIRTTLRSLGVTGPEMVGALEDAREDRRVWAMRQLARLWPEEA